MIIRGSSQASVFVVLLYVISCSAEGWPRDNAVEFHNKPNSCPIQITQTEEGFLITDAGQKVLFYQRRPKSIKGKWRRCNYVHPLYGLDGEILTEDFPADHPHHRGIFWAWHQVFVGDKRVGDSWSLKDLTFEVCEAEASIIDASRGVLHLEVLWKSPLWTDANGKEKPFIKETTAIMVYPAENGFRKIDFEIALLALEPAVRIGGADNEKQYGGFSARIRLPDGIEFVGPRGPVEPKATPLPPAPWMDFSGDFAGDGGISGLAILTHKSNPLWPNRWILRRRASMQNAVWPGRKPVPLSTEKPTVLRYRLIIHRGRCKPALLDKLQLQFTTSG